LTKFLQCGDEFFTVGGHNKVDGRSIVEPQGDMKGFFVGVDADVQVVILRELDCVEPFLFFLILLS